MVDGRLNVNVALNRPAYQVGTYIDSAPTSPYIANRANDGNHTLDMFKGSCAVTIVVANPWWSVDLLVPVRVHGVRFTNHHMDGTSDIIVIILFVQKPKMQQCKTKNMDVEQDTPGSDKLLRWTLKKRVR